MTPEELFDKYHRLPYWYLYKFIPKRSKDEDYRQIASLGLWKACRSYNEGMKSSFTTYAVACIRNEFNTYHRDLHSSKREGNLSLCSLDRTLPGDSTEDRESSFLEIIEDPNSLKSYDNLLDKEFLEYMSNHPYITEKQEELITLIRKGYEPGEIVDELGVTRQRVHQLKKQLKDKFSEEYYHM